MKVFILSILLITALTSFAQDTKNKSNTVYTVVETMPVYPGGDSGLLEFVSKNVEYPRQAKDAGITGVVYVSYVVNKKVRSRR